jgi:hypothetical protein
MKRLLTAGWLATQLGLWFATGPAAAQFIFQQQQPNPFQRPAVSPFINLARPGNAGINYYGLVRPQYDVNRQLLLLQQQRGTTPLGIMPDEDWMTYGGADSGHPSTFFNYSHYFFGQAGTGAGRPVQTPVGQYGRH